MTDTDAMKTQLLRGQKITAVFATDNQIDENMVALQPIRGCKHLTASVKMSWTEKPCWRLETTETGFLDGFDSQSLVDDHTDSSALFDILQTLDRDAVEEEPFDRTIMPSSTADKSLDKLNLSSNGDRKTSSDHLVEESADAPSVLPGLSHSADSIEPRGIQVHVGSTPATENKSRPTLAAIVAQYTEPKDAKPECSGRTDIPFPQTKVPSQAEFTFVANAPLPKMPVAIATKPLKTTDKSKPPSTSMCPKTPLRDPDLPT
jgi:hypothetical protein